MTSSGPSLDRPRLVEQTGAQGFAARLFAAVAHISLAAEEAEVIHQMKRVIGEMGADSATFTSFIRDDSTLASYRYLLACDPMWSAQYASKAWCVIDPWLQHAIASSEPTRESDLMHLSPAQQELVDSSAQHGFRSAMIIPAPSSVGQSRVGVLCIGSSVEGYFDDEGYEAIKPVLRGLAMELHAWWHRRIGRDLMTRARITDDDLVLLRYEDQGHGSKVIAAALGTKGKTIDCRFQRLNGKLGVANRRDALRLGKLYGLI